MANEPAVEQQAPLSDPRAGDLRAAVAGAVDQIEKAAKPAKPAKEPKEPKAEKAKPAQAEPEATPEAAEQEAATAGEVEEQAEPTPAKTDTDAPANWSDADKATFAKLDPEGKTFLLRRHKEMEADYTRKTQEIADLKKDWEPVGKMLEPYRDQMKQRGFTPQSLIGAWMNVEKALMAGHGPEIIARLADNYKIPREQIITALQGAKAAPAEAPKADDKAPPAGPALPPEVAAELAALKQRVDARDHADYSARANKVLSEIENFKTAKAADGSLTHPYFDEVESDMALIAQTYRVSNKEPPPIGDLYEQAVWANTSTRAKLMEAQKAADEKKRADEARAKAVKAKQAASSVTGAPGAGQAPDVRRQPARSIREELMGAMAEAS